MDHALYKTLRTSRGFDYSYFHLAAEDSTLPPLLFLHGFPATSDIWKEQVTYFGERHGFRLVIPDLLGFGGSSKPTNAEAYKPTLICQDIIDILNAEAIQVAVVVGHGMFVAVRNVRAPAHKTTQFAP